jgi:hypothetical protein
MSCVREKALFDPPAQKSLGGGFDNARPLLHIWSLPSQQNLTNYCDTRGT